MHFCNSNYIRIYLQYIIVKKISNNILIRKCGTPLIYFTADFLKLKQCGLIIQRERERERDATYKTT